MVVTKLVGTRWHTLPSCEAIAPGHASRVLHTVPAGPAVLAHLSLRALHVRLLPPVHAPRYCD